MTMLGRNKRFEPSAQCAVADWIHGHGAVPECYTHTPTTSTSARHTRHGLILLLSKMDPGRVQGLK
uniref:Uncharacterized protein n=1 Tax=Magallana gigas TaxID=29159 RepID=K1R5P9_MAGGI